MFEHALPATDHNLKDTFIQGEKGFPIQYYVDELEKYPGKEISLHWHPELEFYVVRGCSLEIQLGQERMIIEEGDGAFINSNYLHAYRPGQKGSSTHPNMVFSAELISPYSSIAFFKYVQPIINDSEIPYLLLKQSILWQKQILDLLDNTFSLLQKYQSASEHYGQFPQLLFKHADYKSSCYELEVQTLLGNIWSIIYENRTAIPRIPVKKSSQTLQIRVQKMIQFMQEHYTDSITLQDISAAAGISKSEAARSFSVYLQTSPGKYLQEYRLKTAQKLLVQTEMTVTEIAESCGFETSSYFCKVFRLSNGMTPLQYRQSVRK